MQIRKETTITPLTTDGKALVAGETVVMIADGKGIIGTFLGMTPRGAVSFQTDIKGRKIYFNLMPGSIASIYKAKVILLDQEEKQYAEN